MRKAVWQRFGVCLLPGLEFQLAADIIRTVVSPTWRDIGGLAAIAALGPPPQIVTIGRSDGRSGQQRPMSRYGILRLPGM